MTSFLKPNEELDWKNQVCGFSRCHHTLQLQQPTKKMMLPSPVLWLWAAGTHLSPSHRGPSLLTASSCWFPFTDAAAHSAGQKDSSGAWSFPREKQQLLTWGWKCTEVSDSSLDTDSVEILKINPLSLFYPKASISGEWMCAHGWSLWDTSFVSVVEKENWFGAIFRQGCFTGNTVKWHALIWANCTFLLFSSLSSSDIWSFYQGHF